jgi:N-acetylglucosamine-6-sulfatase
VATLVVVVAAPDQPDAARRAVQKRPNIVQVMTDDQTVESLRLMPRVRTLLSARGVRFPNHFATYPLCCPARATWLTGQYAHTNGIRGNQGPYGGYRKIASRLSNSLPAWLRRSGYYTGHVGKFLNGYGRGTLPGNDTEVPAGWDEWYGSLDDPDAYAGGTYTMYGYTLNENGQVVHYGSTPDQEVPGTYQTDVYSVKAEDFIRRRAPTAKPFYLSVAPLAPHGEAGANGTFTTAANNPRAAPRHEGVLGSEPLPQPPNFNEADVSDKPAEVRTRPLLGNVAINGIRNRYRSRAESLLAVDEMVQNLVNALRDSGELKNTVLLFTSDNGFFHGEHRVPLGKVRVYEPSVRVPLIIRGPGLPRGKVRRQLTGNIDLAPTILDFANARPGGMLDGISLLPLMRDRLLNPGRAIVLEAFFNQEEEGDPTEPVNRYRAVRTDRYVYVQYGTAERELYDLDSDPYQLRSRHLGPGLTRARGRLAGLLSRLRECEGAVCRSRPALRLSARFRRGPGGCVDSGVRLRVLGKQRKQALRARFYVGSRKAGFDRKRPLRRKVGRRRLSRRRKNRLRANVTVLDGRVRTISRAVPRRC